MSLQNNNNSNHNIAQGLTDAEVVLNDYKKSIIITAALPYANGEIHLGHIASTYLPADIFARYSRLLGKEVCYVCGT
ncbi:MAG: class I tRNA ligase family protein, partial [Nitrososphaeraceae archaeon]